MLSSVCNGVCATHLPGCCEDFQVPVPGVSDATVQICGVKATCKCAVWLPVQIPSECVQECFTSLETLLISRFHSLSHVLDTKEAQWVCRLPTRPLLALDPRGSAQAHRGARPEGLRCITQCGNSSPVGPQLPQSIVPGTDATHQGWVGQCCHDVGSQASWPSPFSRGCEVAF